MCLLVSVYTVQLLTAYFLCVYMSLHIHVFVCAQIMLLSDFTCMPSTSNDIFCIHLRQMKRCYWCQFVFEYTCVCVYFLYIASWKPVVGWILLYAQYANPFSDATKTNALSTVTPSTAQMVMMIEKMMMTVMEMIIMMMTGTPTTWRRRMRTRPARRPPPWAGMCTNSGRPEPASPSPGAPWRRWRCLHPALPLHRVRWGLYLLVLGRPFSISVSNLKENIICYRHYVCFSQWRKYDTAVSFKISQLFDLK